MYCGCFFFFQKSSLKVLGSCCEIATMRETWRSVREALLHQTSFQKEFEKKADSEMTVREMLLKHNRLSKVTKLFQSLQYTGSPAHWILQCLSMREWAPTSRDTGCLPAYWSFYLIVCFTDIKSMPNPRIYFQNAELNEIHMWRKARQLVETWV